PSGVGMYLNDFLKQLIKYKEFEFVLLSDVAESEYIKYFKECGLEVRTQGKAIYRSAGVYKYFKFIQRELDDIKPDVFWEVNTIIPVKLKGDFKTMITVHDMFPIEYVQYFGQVYSIYFRHNLKKTLKNTDMILYNSEQTRKTTENIFPMAKSIKNCNAYIIANPLKDRWDIKDKGYFLYVGNMEKRKGVDLLLKGYARYKAIGGTKELIIAGKMQEEDINQLLTESMAEVGGITYLNYVDHDKKHQLFADCSCFVFPSKAEGFGMPIIEVMKFHKPILVSNLDIYDEIIGSCVNEFDIGGLEEQQIDNLAKGMLSYNKNVDEQEYDRVVARYAPDMLGEKVKNFIIS
ncbi:MAG: glycosyltransferase family 1 protein, partial [Eubacteriales bacterium]|nr:glycosyltransferase family 1 protein [Eubacteriales bacterium]